MSSTQWRPYQPTDENALRVAHAAQCAAAGTEFAFPDFNDPHYVMACVAEQNGTAQGAIVAHATLEVMWVGGNRRAVHAACRQREELAARLRAIGADEVHAFVPRRMLASMEPLMRRLGFRRSNEDFLPFYREL